MSVGLISLCSFVSGLGSCAAFQAALKTGTRPTTGAIFTFLLNLYSNIELADTPRDGIGISSRCIWLERLLLYPHCRYRFPWRYVKFASTAIFWHIQPCLRITSFLESGRSQTWRWIYWDPHYRTYKKRLQPSPSHSLKW